MSEENKQSENFEPSTAPVDIAASLNIASDHEFELDEVDHSEEAPQAGENEKPESTVIVPADDEINTKNWDARSEPDRYLSEEDAARYNYDEALVAPSVNYKTFIRAVDPRMDQLEQEIEKLPAKNQQWFETVAGAVGMYTREGALSNAIRRQEADWRDHVDTGDRQLRTSTASLGEASGDAPLSGVQAIAKATAFTSVGAVLTFPLPHSLIWLTVKAPSDGQLLELERRIHNERAIIGRRSLGRVFSQSDVITKGMLLDLIFRLVVQSTYPTDDPAELRKAILQTDVELLIANFASAVYPNGYPLVRPCLADPGKCLEIAKGRVSIPKMIRYDNNAFTANQRRFLSRRVTRANPAELDSARAEFPQSLKKIATFTRTFRRRNEEVSEQVIFTFRTPSVADYLENGYLWVTELETAADEAFGNKITMSERDAHINMSAEAAALRQYSHWVESIQYRNAAGHDAGRVESREDIFQSLERFSADEKMSDFFFGAVQEYIDSVTVGIVAIPSYDCPSCKKEQPTAGGNFKHLIPLEASELFFTIQRHRSHTLGTKPRI